MEQPITLQEMLEARERRAFRQQALQKEYPVPLICLTMNIAGPVKNSPLIRQGFALGCRRLKERLDAARLTPLYREIVSDRAGNEGFFAVDAPVGLLKQLTCDLEDGSPIGRLFDLDVLDANGEKADRTAFGLPPRTCLICGKPARECARSRTHSVEELQTATTQILRDGIDQADARDAARLACQALLYEVGTTPKPGLVDRNNSGSHRDMDVFTFFNSASALWPYLEACARTGRSTAGLPAPDTFARLRALGRQAEADMLAATSGVNTHKGVIFSMGVVCAALGRLSRRDWRDGERILQECASMTAGLVERDLAGLTEETARTVGQKLYLHHGISGIRGQVEAGFPAVSRTGLPVLKEGIRRGLGLNDAGCATLLAILADTLDTNLVARSDLKTQQEVAGRIRTLLQEDPYPSLETIERIDQEFITRNLSPGGSADLLAVCYLLYFLEKEGEPDV